MPDGQELFFVRWRMVRNRFTFQSKVQTLDTARKKARLFGGGPPVSEATAQHVPIFFFFSSENCPDFSNRGTRPRVAGHRATQHLGLVHDSDTCTGPTPPTPHLSRGLASRAPTAETRVRTPPVSPLTWTEPTHQHGVGEFRSLFV
jgi:hypothetical protein